MTKIIEKYQVTQVPKFSVTLTVLVLMLITGCGGELDSNDGEVLSLNGGWRYECLEVVVDGLGEARSRSLTISESSFTDERKIFTLDEDSCDSPIQMINVSGDLSKTESSTVSGLVNFYVKSASMTINDENTIDAFNGQTGSRAVCGGGWVLGVEKTLSSASCSAESDTSVVFAGETIYDRFELTASQLFLGFHGNTVPSRESERPERVDRDLVLYR